MQETRHRPALLRETLELLAPSAGKLIVDCTVGAGGHAKEILRQIAPDGFLIGIDKDADALSYAERSLEEYKGAFKLIHADFKHIEKILAEEGIDKVDGLLFDLGVSSLQLDEPGRGFSFLREGPLDMRMDMSADRRASDLVNRLSEDELAEILSGFGEERFSKRISRAIANARKRRPIQTTSELRNIIHGALASSVRYARIDPATRTFQALRIVVNDELGALDDALECAPCILKRAGRACVISFHSLEDRIVKNKFKRFSQEGILRLLNKKPIRPTQDEIEQNSRARSAKLRGAERV